MKQSHLIMLCLLTVVTMFGCRNAVEPSQDMKFLPSKGTWTYNRYNLDGAAAGSFVARYDSTLLVQVKDGVGQRLATVRHLIGLDFYVEDNAGSGKDAQILYIQVSGSTPLVPLIALQKTVQSGVQHSYGYTVQYFDASSEFHAPVQGVSVEGVFNMADVVYFQQSKGMIEARLGAIPTTVLTNYKGQ